MKNAAKAAERGAPDVTVVLYRAEDGAPGVCCGATHSTGSMTQSCVCYQAEHKLMKLLPLGATELSLMGAWAWKA